MCADLKIFKAPQLVPLDLKEQQIYFKVSPDLKPSHAVMDNEATNPAEKPNFPTSTRDLVLSVVTRK